MKRLHILTTTAAALVILSAPTFAAPKKGKTAADTAKRIIDGLLDDGKKPAGPAGNVAQYSGKWNIEDGSGAVTVTAAGAGALVHWDFAKGGGDDGVGIERGGKFYIGYGGGPGMGVLVFQIAGGKLIGSGVSSKGGVQTALAETLTGPATLFGDFRSGRGEKVQIAPAANDSYLIVWTKTKRSGFGKKIGNELVVTFEERDMTKANLVVYSPGANKLEGMYWTTLGKEGGNENLVRPAGVPFAIAGKPRVDKYGNVIPDGPAPAGLEKPIDLPVAPPVAVGKPAIVGKPAVVGKPAPAAVNLDDQQSAFMRVHNDARAEVGVTPLMWDPTLAAYAQEWANQLAKSGKFEHRPNGKYGENLAGFHPPDGPDSGARMWLGEKKDYRGERIDNRNFMKVGHYTQMVWRQTQRVGYGFAKNAKGMWVLVANYEPAGNMIGEHPYAGGANVAVAPPAAVAPAAPAVPVQMPAPAAPVPAVGIPGPAAPVVGGIAVQFPKEWTNTQNGKTVTSVSPDGSARVIIRTVTGQGADGPWDEVQAKMAQHLAPHFPGLENLVEVGTEHDVMRDGVGLRVVTYTAKFNGAPVDIVVDFARENNVDGNGLVLIIRCSEQGNVANQTAAKKVAESLRLKK